MTYKFSVKNFSGELAVFLLQNGVSRRQLTRLRKRDGAIRLNGRSVFSNTAVRDGDEIAIDISDIKAQKVPVSSVQVPVVFEDEHFCVLDKPAGLAVIATKKYYGDSLQNALAAKWGRNFAFHPVNRLDKDTSGLMIVAKNSFVHSLFDAMLRKNEIEKTYFAVVEGVVKEAGEVNEPILDDKTQMKRVVSPDGKNAITRYAPLETNGDMTLLEIKLLTGRTHQIRVHMSYIGHPLCGDKLYGSAGEAIARQALHAGRLDFRHPVGGRHLSFASPLPEDIKKLLQ